MSIILKDGEGKIIMYTKGSDQILKPRLTNSLNNKIIYECLNRYAKNGLRTLVITSKSMSSLEFHEWKYKYKGAKLNN